MFFDFFKSNKQKNTERMLFESYKDFLTISTDLPPSFAPLIKSHLRAGLSNQEAA